MINVSTSLPIDLNSDISTRIALEKLPHEVKELRFKTYQHVGFKEGLNALRETFAMSGFESIGCTLFGPPGVGKSRLIRYFTTEVYMRPEYQPTDELTPIPIVSIRVPGRPTIPKLCEQILKIVQRHYTPPTSRDDSITLRTGRILKHLGVEMIIFDEFQHLLRESAQIRTNDVLAFIKVLMDECELSVVFAGLPGAAKLLEEHTEIEQRVSFAKADLHPFSLANEGPSNIQVFASYIKSIEVNFTELNTVIFPLANTDMLNRIYLATLGIPRRISQLFNRVMFRYYQQSTIDKDEFQLVFAQMPFNHIKEFPLFTAPKSKVIAQFSTLLKRQKKIPLTKETKHKQGSRLGN